MNKEYMEKVCSDSTELILMGHSLANAGHFMKRVLREQILSQKAIDKYNATLRKSLDKSATIGDMELEMERLKKLLEEARKKV